MYNVSKTSCKAQQESSYGQLVAFEIGNHIKLKKKIVFI